MVKVKQNPAFAVTKLLTESPSPPTLGLEELFTAAHDITHGLTELLTPITHAMAASAHGPERMVGELLTPITHGMAASAHGPERTAGEVANTTKTPNTSSAVKRAMLRIANGLCADCAQDKRAMRESAKRNLVREQR